MQTLYKFIFDKECVIFKEMRKRFGDSGNFATNVNEFFFLS